jgi:hypothetical protein
LSSAFQVIPQKCNIGLLYNDLECFNEYLEEKVFIAVNDIIYREVIVVF